MPGLPLRPLARRPSAPVGSRPGLPPDDGGRHVVVPRRVPARRPCGSALAVVALLGLAGCGVRLETPPPDLPSPDAAEVARQGAVERSESLAAGAAEAARSTADAAVAELLSRVSADGLAQAEELGGLWVPPAWATPTATPGATTTPGPAAATATPGDVLAALAAAAESACADAVAAGPGDLATLLASVCLSQDAAAADLSAALGSPPPASPTVLTDRDAPPTASGLPASLTTALAATDGATALGRSLDAAGFALEVAAARTPDGSRADVAALAARHRAQARDVLAAAGVLGTAADPRRAAYTLPVGADGALLGAAAVVPAVEDDLVAAWAATVTAVDGPARAAVVGEMGQAWTTARQWGARPVTFPGLPELES